MADDSLNEKVKYTLELGGTCPAGGVHEHYTRSIVRLIRTEMGIKQQEEKGIICKRCGLLLKNESLKGDENAKAKRD